MKCGGSDRSCTKAPGIHLGACEEERGRKRHLIVGGGGRGSETGQLK